MSSFLSKILRKKVLLAIIFLVAVFSGFIYYRTSKISAQGVLPFGGMVLASVPCTCSGGDFLLTIGPPSNIQLVFNVATPQYEYMQLPRPGVWSLGLYTPGAVCMAFVGKGCAPIGAPLGRITMVGTSL